MSLGKLKLRNKNNKLLYYISVLSRELIPKWLLRSQLKKKLTTLQNEDRRYVLERVNYYNKLRGTHPINKEYVALENIKIPKKARVYYFDSQEYFCYFDPTLKVSFCWGDITFVPKIPSIVKSRPISSDNDNAIILNLNKIRHFNFIKDRKDFRNKKNMLIARANVFQPHRIRFYEMYFNHPLCDIGQINYNINKQWVKEKMGIAAHLEFKFILSLEGNDVATNLKWIMSSNSIAVMPTPKYETWFMEGKLVPDYHYIHIKDDFSDLEERLQFYIENPEKALQIISNAHNYIEQFNHKDREALIALMVMEKYFYSTGQLETHNHNLYK